MNRSALLATLAFGIAQDVVFGLIFLSFMNYYLLDVVGASSAAPGYTLALYGGTKLIVHPLAGRLLDLTWPRLVCVLGIGIQAFALFLLIGSDSVVVFYVAASLLGAGSATMWPLVYALMAGTQPADVRPRVGAILATTGYLATGAGFGLGVLLAELEANRAAFLAALVILGIPALSIATRLFPRRARSEREESPGAERTRTVTALVLFSLVIFIDYSALSSLAGLYGPYIRRTLDLTLLRAAIMLGPAGLAALGSLLAVSRWSRTRRRFLEMAVLYVGATAGAAILASTTNQWVAAAAAVPLAAGIGGIGPLVAATVLDVGGGSGRGDIIGALMSVEGLGSVLGPGGVALVVDIFGPRGGFTAITTMFAVLIVLTLYAYTFQHRARREAAA